MKFQTSQIEKFLLTLFLISIPLNRSHIFRTAQSFDLKIIQLYISDVLLMALLIFSLVTRKFLKRGDGVGLFVFFCFLLLTLSVSPRETYTYYQTSELIGLAFLLVYFKNIPREWFRYSSIVAFLSAVAQSLLSIVQFFKQRSVGLKFLGEPILSPQISGIAKFGVENDKLIRGYGTFPHPNPLSAFLAVACATGFYLILNEKKPKLRAFWVIFEVILLIGEFSTFSRAGITATILSLVIFLVLVWKSHKNQLQMLVFTVLSGLIISTAVFYPFLQQRVAELTPTIYNRSYYNRLGLQIFQEHWLLGTGPGNTLNKMAEKIHPDYLWEVQPPHNFFLLVACETGVIGLFVILILFAKAFLNLLKDLKEPRSLYLLSCWLGILFLMFFDHYFYTIRQTQLLLALIIGLSLQKIVPYGTITNRVESNSH